MAIIKWLFGKLGMHTDGTFRAIALDYLVNKIFTKIKTEFLEGTLSNDSETYILHGVPDFNKIMMISCSLKGLDGNYYPCEVNCVIDPQYTFLIKYNEQHIIISNIGTAFRNKNYRIKMQYKI